MFSKVRSMGIAGISGFEVICECDLSAGLPSFEIVGLPDAAVKESRDRVRACIKNCGFEFPLRRITVNLAPADTKKEGPLYDLPILLSILLASEQLKSVPGDAAFIGELSLDGKLRPVNGALPMAADALAQGINQLFLPFENGAEAAFADGATVYPVKDVQSLIAHLQKKVLISPLKSQEISVSVTEHMPDFSEVRGQENVKRAVEIAAAGGHNILLVGPPGGGKSMIARRIPSILPGLSREEALECTKIHSVAGLTDQRHPLVTERPFRSPHHTISAISLTGGGRTPRPGEISLAHNGVLFLDEFPEFHKDALEVLRQPVEDGYVTISRVAGTMTYPSSFMLVCAMNPCKCGWYGHPSGRCTCNPQSVESYQNRISGPMLDRIDLQIEVPAVDFDKLSGEEIPESSADIRKRVEAARAVQRVRLGPLGRNANMTGEQIRLFCKLDAAGTALLEHAFVTMGMTARSYNRVLRVARTVADLEGAENILPAHLAEALAHRFLDRKPQ